METLIQARIAAQKFGRQHHRSIVACAAALLVLGAATAFAIAPMAPDAADLPKALVSQMVEPEDVAPQREALAASGLHLHRSDLTRAGDTADSLLQRLGVADAAAVAFLRSDSAARRIFDGRAARMVQVRSDDDGHLLEMVVRSPAPNSEQQATHFSRLNVVRNMQGNWQSSEELLPLASQTRLASGTIRSSLFAASDEARIPDSIAVQMAELFAGDIDMHRELRRGDVFSVVYEALTADGEPIAWQQGTGRVLAAEFVNGGKTYHAAWFRDAAGKGAYYDFTGQSRKRAFLASPMEFSRVTSGFAMRMHPLLQTWRAHLGVDYAAPSGTPVRSVGDGTVDFSGWQNGYGNVVQIRHANERSTVYAHLSRIDVKRGQRVEQGQHLGAVGSTGWSTGPHLHFEFRVNGQHQDPLRVARSSEAVAIVPAAAPEFAALAKSLQSQLALAETLIGARGRSE